MYIYLYCQINANSQLTISSINFNIYVKVYFIIHWQLFIKTALIFISIEGDGDGQHYIDQQSFYYRYIDYTDINIKFNEKEVYVQDHVLYLNR